MNFNNIPHKMRVYRNWIVWRLEDKGRKKPTKSLIVFMAVLQKSMTLAHGQHSMKLYVLVKKVIITVLDLFLQIPPSSVLILMGVWTNVQRNYRKKP